MESSNDLDQIRKYWAAMAHEEFDEQRLRPTARDPFLQRVVEDAMSRWLWPNLRLLDVGCGDGRSTLYFSDKVGYTVGVDYIDEFVKRAECAAKGRSSVCFTQADILDLSPIRERFGRFDVITTIRCLINLANWDNQRLAIEQIAQCLEPGGLYLASEGWQEGLVGLNLIRARAGLPRIEAAQYNCMISRSVFECEVRRHFDIVTYAGLGFYLFMSRVFQAVFVSPEQPRHDHPINAIAAGLQDRAIIQDPFPDCDYAGVYVLRRKP